MNREIKFRAWDRTKKTMTFINNLWVDFAVIGQNHIDEKVNIHTLTLMQYTGLKDKNSNEIYEGDILKRGLTFDEVIFDEGAFCVKFYSQGLKKTYIHSMKSTLFDKINKWEVIGNIYENPKLLKELKNV